MNLDAIEQRTRAATKGPWKRSAEQDDTPVVYRDHPTVSGAAEVIFAADWGTEADAEFAAAARTDVPALVARVRELEEENQRLRKTAHDAFRLGLRLEDQPGTIYHRSFWEEPEDHLRYMSTYTGGNASTRKEQQ